MGSFQQVFMGGTCLIAAFFFGSYLHNRPAENTQVDASQLASADSLDSLFSFGKKVDSGGETKKPPVIVQHQSHNFGASQQLPPAPVVPAIDPSERIPSMAFGDEQRQTFQSTEPKLVSARKPVVPDFSELASRFRNSPLELSGAAANPNVANPNVAKSAVHESEKVPEFSSVFETPEMVIRQPERSAPIQNFSREVDRIENSIQSEFAQTEPRVQPQRVQPQPETTRWRVNRSRQIDQFRNEGRAPRQDYGSQESIEDVLSKRSADYLKNADESQTTFATDPVQDDWMTARRLKVTQKAARRNQDLLEVEDPGNRFQQHVMGQGEAVDPPEPDYETAYYQPSQQRQDAIPPRPSRGMQRIQSGVSSNWNRRSNIQSQFTNTYEIQRGDTLQSISMRFYGSADYYLEIYKANREVLDQITNSPAGVEIEIPKLNN